MADAAFRMLIANENRPEKIVSTLNISLAERNESMMFATFFLGILDLTTGILTYCNAGHEAPILVSGDKPKFLDIESNVPLGVMPGWNYKAQQESLISGTTLFLYTDGLTEAENKDHTQFGRDNIMATLSTPSTSSEMLIGIVTDAVQDFVGDAEQSDDLTLLAIRYRI